MQAQVRRSRPARGERHRGADVSTPKFSLHACHFLAGEAFSPGAGRGGCSYVNTPNFSPPRPRRRPTQPVNAMFVLTLHGLAASAAAPSTFELVGHPKECNCLDAKDPARQLRLETYLAATPRAPLLQANHDKGEHFRAQPSGRRAHPSACFMPAANHSMLNMAARYGNAPAVRALLRAGAEASHADVSGWHMPLHHVTHCKGCSEEVALRIAQMLVNAGAEPGLARDKNGVTASVGDKLAQPLARWHSGGYLKRQTMAHAAPSLGRPASPDYDNQPVGPRWPAIQGLVST